MLRTVLLAATFMGATAWHDVAPGEELPSLVNPFRAAQEALDRGPQGLAPPPREESTSSLLSDPASARAAARLSPELLQLGPLDEAEAPQTETVQFLDEICGFSPPRQGGNNSGTYWQLFPQGLIYRPYLAGAQESRFRGVWNHEHNDGGLWDITLGGHVGLIRHGTRGDARPEGWQLSIEGAALVRLDVDENMDVNASDFRFGIPWTWGNAVYQTKFAYYHLSSHVGDEFLLRTSGFERLNYSRDVLVWGHSYYLNPRLRSYFEIGYGVFTDVSEPWELQFGFDYAPPGNTGSRGAPFAAVNGHLREEVDFGGNFVAQAGWAWRRSAASGMFRLGVEYYNGKDDQFSFFDDSVQKVGFGLWYDY